MSEVSMRNTMRDHFKAHYAQLNPHWVRLESTVGMGVPDIYWCVGGMSGWIEAKQMDADKLPKRSATPVRIGLKQEQVLWLNEERAAGGRCSVIAKLGREWFVWTTHFQTLKDGATLEQLRMLSTRNWTGKFDPELAIVSVQ